MFGLFALIFTALLCFWPRTNCEINTTDVDDLQYEEIDEIAIPRIIFASTLCIITFVFSIQFVKETLFESFNLTLIREDLPPKCQ